MGKLTISRDSGWADCFRSYRILIDGKEVALIRDGETFTREMEPGEYEVEARIDWCSSRRLRVTVPAEECKLILRSALRGWRFLLGVPYVLFHWHGYLQLEQSQ